MARGGKKPETGRNNASKPSKPKSERTSNKEVSQPQEQIPLELQQKCLDIFRDAFEPGPDDATILQEVKGHLYNRDFAAAFGREDYLRVYASRWSPSRALAYLQVLKDIEAHFGSQSAEEEDILSVASLGGGAGAELVTFAGWSSLQEEIILNGYKALDLTLVDIADWSSVTHALHDGISTPPVISKYASQARKDANQALLDERRLSVAFQQQDVLLANDEQSKELEANLSRMNLVTFMFTLNELYSTSMPKTQDLITRITEAMKPGSCLLVVDSPGSYSTVSINNTEKKYPMQWLLDFTLLGSPQKRSDDASTAKWEKLVSDDSRWFRLHESLRYPIDLENMRYQIHFYRRLGDD